MSNEAVPFSSVLAWELGEIERRRAARKGTVSGSPSENNIKNGEQPPNPGAGDGATPPKLEEQEKKALEMNLVGLAFSGGGIRSATFNLGVLQALADKRCLRHIDYLSTVSGGGYIGSWLSARLGRPAEKKQQTEENGIAAEVMESWLRTSQHDEPHEIRWLRRFSNYLTPSVGLFSPDTWTFAAIYLRNLLLNLAILMTMFSLVLLVPKLLVYLSKQIQNWEIPISTSLVFALVVIAIVGYNIRSFEVQKPKKGFLAGWAIQCALVLLTLAAYTAVIGFQELKWGGKWWYWGLGNIAAYSLAWALVAILGWIPRRGDKPRDKKSKDKEDKKSKDKEDLKRTPWIQILLCAIPSGFGGGLLLWYINSFASKNEGLGLAFGPPAILATYFLIGVIHVGLLGSSLDDDRREWMSRFGAWMLIYALAWTVISATEAYGEEIAKMKGDWKAAALTSCWLGLTLIGLLGNRPTSSGEEANKPFKIIARRSLRLLARLAPFIFITGSMLWLIILKDYMEDEKKLISFAVALSVSFALLSWRIDVNEFSMHSLYRNRLVRCFLGASVDPLTREAERQPFTGFYRKDDFHLSELAKSRLGAPYHLINTTLNLAKGKELAWQKRKAASFVLSPKYCGFGRKDETVAYRATGEGYGGSPKGLTLGSAMAISGAAVSPNMGSQTSASSFLLTVFNARLGQWLGNPKESEAEIKAKEAEAAKKAEAAKETKKEKEAKWQSIWKKWRSIWKKWTEWKQSIKTNNWKRSGPRYPLIHLVKEMLAQTDEEHEYVYLSDGGHFDVLGVYELIKRHVRFIIAVDAAADPKPSFADLANLVQKCRIDFGIEIDIHPENKIINTEGGGSSHCVFGTIYYDRIHPGVKKSPDKDPCTKNGLILYIKPSLTRDEPQDILRYSSHSGCGFPQQKTVDQWFDEAQFECYRKLGHHIASNALQGRPFSADGTIDFQQIQSMVTKREEEDNASRSQAEATPAEVLQAVDQETPRLASHH